MKNINMTGKATKSIDMPQGTLSGRARFISSSMADKAIIEASKDIRKALEATRDIKVTP
jgi:hypothetical protein